MSDRPFSEFLRHVLELRRSIISTACNSVLQPAIPVQLRTRPSGSKCVIKREITVQVHDSVKREDGATENRFLVQYYDQCTDGSTSSTTEYESITSLHTNC
jgi:hypothetical protein